MKQGQSCRLDDQKRGARLSGNPMMAGATVHWDLRHCADQAAQLEQQSNAQLQFLLLDQSPEFLDYGLPKIDVQA